MKIYPIIMAFFIATISSLSFAEWITVDKQISESKKHLAYGEKIKDEVEQNARDSLSGEDLDRQLKSNKKEYDKIATFLSSIVEFLSSESELVLKGAFYKPKLIGKIIEVDSKKDGDGFYVPKFGMVKIKITRVIPDTEYHCDQIVVVSDKDFNDLIPYVPNTSIGDMLYVKNCH